MWKMDPPKNAQLVCVSDFPVVTYSGMLPGVIAGQYPKSAMEIDLVRLAQSAGARVIVGKVTGLDHQRRELLFADRPPLNFDVMSIGIGSRPSFKGVEVDSANCLLAVKPMQTFLARLAERLIEVQKINQTPRIAIVGGGVGSIEIAFCLYERFFGKPKHAVSPWPVGLKPKIEMVTGGQKLGTGLLESSVRKISNELRSRAVEIHTRCRVNKVDSAGLKFTSGDSLDADVVIWATSAVGSPILSELGLENDERGFLLTKQNLEVTNLPGVFAVGDTGTIVGSDISKAGVFAVRQGPILTDNIRRLIKGEKDLRDYHPQKGFLKLVNFGNDRAIAEYKGQSFANGFSWKLKDYIDVKFMKMYQDYQPMDMAPPTAEESEATMRCLGCGGKVGSQILSDVLRELQIDSHPDVKIGLDNPDDAAVIATHNNEVTVTTDFFAAPFDDPYLVGRIAALNSASDCFVMGAKPTSALAIVQLPLGHPRAQTQVMREIMVGSVEEFNSMGAAVVGGHSIEGPRTMVGFTVLGKQVVPPKTKGMLQPGDRLILTKPLGTGILLAAWMQCQMPADCYHPLVETMLQSNEVAIELVNQFNVSALTDVTGFGFIGHLIELMRASNVSVKIDSNAIPVLQGCQELVDAGIESTLAPDNQSLAGRVNFESKHAITDSALAPLFDPQTGGGLLFGVEHREVEAALGFLGEKGFGTATVVGEVGVKNEQSSLEITS